jgi:hypothetical protein
MNRKGLQALADRLNFLPGPCAVTDDALCRLATFVPEYGKTPPRFTSSIDDALALVERLLPGCAWSVSRITNDMHMHTPRGPGFGALVEGPGYKSFRKHRSSACLALLLAALAVLIDKGGSE